MHDELFVHWLIELPVCQHRPVTESLSVRLLLIAYIHRLGRHLAVEIDGCPLIEHRPDVLLLKS